MLFFVFEFDFELYVQLNNYQFDLGRIWQERQKPQLDNCNHKFIQLKVVVLRNFKYLPSELELVKIVLQRATNLERLVLIPPRINGRCKFKREDTPKYEKLLCSWKASERAIVELQEKYIKKSFINPTHPQRWLYTYEG